MASDTLAKWQAQVLGGAYASERHRHTVSEDKAIEDEAKDRRKRKRSKLAGVPKFEPEYQMQPIKKPKGWKREYKTTQERANEAADLERGS